MDENKMKSGGRGITVPTRSSITFLQQLAHNRLYSLSLTVVLLIVLASVLWPQTFPRWENFTAVALNLSFDTIVAVGMMILMISGAFDLSVGSVLGAAAGFSSLMLLNKVPIVLTILFALIVAMAFGFANGLIVAKIGVNPMITTLAMMGIGQGTMLMMTADKFTLPPEFLVLGQETFLGIRIPFWIAMLIVIIFSVMVSKLSFFKRYYYIGGNERAARLSGIPVEKMKILSFVLASALAGVAGILLTARMGGFMVTYGKGMELRVITAVIIGGASLKGGVGVVPGALLGTVFMALVNNIMIIANVSVYWQQIIVGIILLGAVSIDVLLKKKAA